MTAGAAAVAEAVACMTAGAGAGAEAVACTTAGAAAVVVRRREGLPVVAAGSVAGVAPEVLDEAVVVVPAALEADRASVAGQAGAGAPSPRQAAPIRVEAGCRSTSGSPS